MSTDIKFHFTQTEHDPQVWGREDSDWAARMEEACSRIGDGRHRIVDSAEAADIVVFWEPHQDLQAVWAPRLRADPLIQEFPDKAFVVSVEDNPLGFLPGLYCSLSKRLLDRRRHRSCFYHRTPNARLNSASTPVARRDPTRLASFVGARSHSVRDRLFKIGARLAGEGVHLRETERGRYNSDPRGLTLESERTDYVESILDARFSLCPRGNGVATFRLQETMALARVPVVISDEWEPIVGPDWSRFAVFVNERDIGRLPEILRAYEPGWKEMGAMARQVFDQYYANGNYLKHSLDQIVEIYQSREHDERDCFSRWDEMIETERRRRNLAGGALA
ncbi:MAG: hypothetical protein ACI9VS_001815 [Candidatus Binatia bacterium]|jgi:hypothetical protein